MKRCETFGMVRYEYTYQLRTGSYQHRADAFIVLDEYLRRHFPNLGEVVVGLHRGPLGWFAEAWWRPGCADFVWKSDFTQRQTFLSEGPGLSGGRAGAREAHPPRRRRTTSPPKRTPARPPNRSAASR